MYTADTKAKRIAAAQVKIDHFKERADNAARDAEAANAEAARWQQQKKWLQGMPTVDDAPPEDAP